MEIRVIGQSIFDLFFPHRCVSCHSVVSQNTPLCVNCAALLPFTHWKFNKDNVGYEKLKPLCATDSVYSLLYFHHDSVTRKLLHSLKYHQTTEIGEMLADAVLDEIKLDNYEGIIPVPIHPSKLRKRGYNQVISFTERLGLKSQIHVLKNTLVRVENNPSQVHKNRERRLNSIKNAFAVQAKIKSGKYILVDDVLTTGATVSQCVNLLKANKGVKISVLTMACAV